MWIYFYDQNLKCFVTTQVRRLQLSGDKLIGWCPSDVQFWVKFKSEDAAQKGHKSFNEALMEGENFVNFATWGQDVPVPVPEV